ncbi:MAG: hypothetical protein O9311_08140 [Cytophagales bacterium]|nr:hypothetical protein [Cytophagales bacterium]
MTNNELLVPVVLGVVSLIWNYFQSKRLQKIELEARAKKVVHKFQFEKEFETYKELWPRLIDLKESVGKTLVQSSPTRESLKEVEINYHLVRDFFERNKPFYPHSVYQHIADLLVMFSSDLFWRVVATPEESERQRLVFTRAIELIDVIADKIRDRINPLNN